MNIIKAISFVLGTLFVLFIGSAICISLVRFALETWKENICEIRGYDWNYIREYCEIVE